MKKKNILLIIFIVMFILCSCESKTFIDNGKWYYFNEIGLMLKNSFVDGGYYIEKLVKNEHKMLIFYIKNLLIIII